MTDLFNRTELISSESMYRAPDGSLLGRVVLTSGERPKKQPWYGLVGRIVVGGFVRPTFVSSMGIVRIEDADGRPLLTLRGTPGMCEVRDLNGKNLGYLGLLSATPGEVMRSRLLPGNRAWSVTDKPGNVLFKIVPGAGGRTITSGNGTQLAVWNGDRLTVTQELPSPLRELVIALPAAAELIPGLAP
jgi:hypothetical protein